MTSYLLERAWVDGEVRETVRVEIEDGVFTSVEPDASRTATPLRGLTLPGFANTHSHVFHRALRGRTQRGSGTFWTWREQMYDAAARLDPDSCFALARATYAEMLAAGYTSVSEFHYVHHQPDGTPYDDPNALGHALVAAAEATGIRLTLLDTCYLAGGIGQPVAGSQVRFSDGDADRWAERVASIEHARVGGAIHSVRAVPREQMPTVVAALRGRPLHAHVSEQPAENDACLAAYGLTPTGVLADAGALGPDSTAVHATHLTDGDIALLAETGTEVSLCPTTERDLGDGIGPARALADAGVRITVGSDSQAVVDPFEEVRAWEMDERLGSISRGRFSAADLLGRTTGRIAVGEPADLVTIDLTSPRTAGTGGDEHTAVFAATSADVVHVVAGGRPVFDGDHARIGRELAAAIDRLWS
ncbi:MAG TPA: formimidoylglutamate deiminase [Nocardioides sp.]|nr:formimidoylglutamate deiminase [Nocardioides sp.]